MLYGAMNFPVRPVLDELQSISALGFDYLELTLDPPQAHYTAIRSQKERLMEALDRAGMGLVCHLPTFLSTADLTESLREASLREMVESIRLAAEIRPLKMVLHPSFIFGLAVFVREKAKAYAMRALEVAVEEADRLGVCLCLENMFPPANLMVEPEDFMEVFERFPSLKLIMDIGHAHIRSPGGKRVFGFMDRFRDRLSHVHVSDNFGKEDNHLPIGAGVIDYPKILKALKKTGYDQTITLEVFSNDRDYLRVSRDKVVAMLAAASP